MFASPDQARQPHLHYLPLFRERYVIVIGFTHRFANLEAVRVADLNAEEYLRRVHCEVSEVLGLSLDHHDSHPPVLSIGAIATTGSWRWPPPEPVTPSCRQARSSTSRSSSSPWSSPKSGARSAW